MTFDIKVFNNISEEGLKQFDDSLYTINQTQNPDALLLRSKKLHDMTFSEHTIAISRAGAGTNNIPVDRCTKDGIVVFNTPGANANAVKELVLANLLLSARPILKSAQWVQTITDDNVEEIVEAEKKSFVGTELEGKKLGVIGLGAIGAMVANDAYRLGMEVMGYDPYVSVDTAWNISRRVKRVTDLDELLSTSDYISLHVPLMEKTHHLISTEELKKMAPEAVLLNFSRGELVDNNAVLQALADEEIAGYITDFAEKSLLGHEKITVLPHLGASTEEAEINCARMSVRTLKNYLETGNIKRSVNFPTVEMSFNTEFRLAVFHENVPNMIGAISNIIADAKYNIDNLSNRSRGDVAYTLIDLDHVTEDQAQELAEELKSLSHVIRVRHIKNLQRKDY
ncbi:phosphoglycerate dehydrogenase [Vagococcus elongatus]|uniref:D-3-phosphoglycerate dehydrogenase n=1 Tax=Vagococcus elongatus TaxID=180344 RepID=A0A430AU84_9ENTE|nr:phosphoglycerate dehydrogenase [Vagococcus elongatus]RSU11614.1 3-phosphoglycerate dehydrogenase [Vagococcus elongatus]